MIKKICNLLKDSASEKVNSPILGALLSFWFVFNWKIPLILIFSDASIEGKIETIDTLQNITSSFVVPLVCTTVFLIFYIISKSILLRFQEKIETSSTLHSHKMQLKILESEEEVIIAQRHNEEAAKTYLKNSGVAS